MKTKMLGLITLFMFAAVVVFAQNNLKTEEFKVKGNGEACKERIEEAAESVEGVDNADWNMETHMLTVEFDKSQTTLDDIQQAIAEVGHDTPNFKASDEAYKNLPEGSKYRKESHGATDMKVKEEKELKVD